MSENEIDAQRDRRNAIFISIIVLISILFGFLVYLLISGSSDKKQTLQPTDSISQAAQNKTPQSNTQVEKQADPMEDFSVSWQQVNENLQSFEDKHKSVIEQFLLKQHIVLPNNVQTPMAEKKVLSVPKTHLDTTISSRLLTAETQPQWSALYPQMQQLIDIQQSTLTQFLQGSNQ